MAPLGHLVVFLVDKQVTKVLVALRDHRVLVLPMVGNVVSQAMLLVAQLGQLVVFWVDTQV